MTTASLLLAVLAMGAVTYFLRSLPFLFFGRREPPALVAYIARYMPPVIMTILVLNSFKGLRLDRAPYGLPELGAAAVVAALQAWKRNVLLSIIGGTALYMVLIRVM
jgi:branched-subunit amino acid transport protein AzlD